MKNLFSKVSKSLDLQRLLIATTFILLVQGAFAQVSGDYRSAGSNNWGTLATWERYNGSAWATPSGGQGYPGQFAGTGNVQILDGHTVTINISPANAIGSLTVGNGTSGILAYDNTNRALGVTGNLLIQAGATFRSGTASTRTHTLNIGGNFTNNGNFNSRNTATNVINTTMNGTSAQLISGTAVSGSFVFNSLTISNTSDVVSAANNFVVNTTLSVSANATFEPSATTQVNPATRIGTLSGSGKVRVTRTTATADLRNQLLFTTYTLTGLTIEYTGAGAQSVNQSSGGTSPVGTYGALIISGSGTKTSLGILTVTNNLNVIGTLNISAFALTAGNLTGSGTISNSGASAIVSTGANNTSTTFSGVIQNAIALTKTGTGTLTLSGVNTFTGATTINGGAIELGINNAISGGGNLTLNNGTLTTGVSLGYNSTFGQLSLLTNNSNINLGTGSHTLTFASAGTFTANRFIVISGWLGNYNTGASSAGKIYVGSTSTTLTTPQKNGIKFFDGTTYFASTQLSDGEVVPDANAANSFSSVASGNWNAPATWGFTGTAIEGLTYPAASSSVTINATHTVDLQGTSYTTGSIAGAGTIGSTSGTPTFTVGGDASNTSFSGIIQNAISLVKEGAGTLNLSGANSYTGATTINGGKIELGAANSMPTTALTIATGAIFDLNGFSETIGTIAGAGTITNSGAGAVTLTSSGTTPASTVFSGIIENGTGGNLAFTRSGNSTLTLSGANTYSGTTTLSAGTLNINHANALGSGTLSITGTSTLDNTSGSLITISNNQNWSSANFTFTGTNNLSISGDVTLGGSRTITVSGGLFTLEGVISGSGTLIKPGAGTLTLAGANTYSGGTTLSSGNLNINHAQAIGTGTFTINGGTIDNTSGASVTVSSNNAMIWNTIELGFTGTNNLNMGTGSVTMSQATTINAAGGNLTIGGVITDGASSFRLTKIGAGAITLKGNNTYDNDFSLDGGVVNIEHANALGTGTFRIGQTLSSAISFDNTSASAITIANAVRFYNNFTFIGNQALTLSGAVDMRANSTATIQNNTLTISGIITENTGGLLLTKSGSGPLLLSNANTYTGGTTISDGTLIAANSTALGTTAGVLTLNGGTLDIRTGTGTGSDLANYNMVVSANSTVLIGRGTSGAAFNHTAGSLTLGAFNLTINSGTNITTGTPSLTLSTLTLTGAGTLSPGTATLQFSSTIAGNFKLTKSGAGILQRSAGTWAMLNDFEINQGTYNANRLLSVAGLTTISGGTFSVSTTAVQTLTGGLTISGGTLTGSTGNISTSNVILSSGTLTAPSGSLNVTGSWTNNGGTFTPGANTVTFNGGTSQTIGGSVPTVFNHVTASNASGVNLANTITVNNLSLASTTTFSDAGNQITASGTITQTAGSTLKLGGSAATAFPGFSNTTLTSGTVEFAASVAQNATGGITYNNLTISNNGSKTLGGNLSVNGILNLNKSNVSNIEGALETGAYVLTLGPASTITGSGEVTGVVERNSFSLATNYSFGSPNTMINISAGTIPSWIRVKITLTTDHTWLPTCVHRYYDIAQSGGNSTTKITLQLSYLESELNGLTEGSLDIYDYHIVAEDDQTHGHTNQDGTNNWVSLNNISITYAASGGTSFGSKYWSIGPQDISGFIVWLGAVDGDWNVNENWVGNAVPIATSDVLIPDASTTSNDPTLPASTTIKSLQIAAGGILEGGNATLTVTHTAAWSDQGTFNEGTSTVIFTNANAVLSGNSDFYNLTVANGAKLTLPGNSITAIEGSISLSATGVLDAATLESTVDFDGSDPQTIINPNFTTSGFHNITLSGTGPKTFPATLNVRGNWTNNSTTTSTNTIVFNGPINSNQSIAGSTVTTFGGLTINNTGGVILSGTDATVSGSLTFTSGLITTGANKLILTTSASSTGAGAGKYVLGNLQLNIPNSSSPSATFDVGDATTYSPVTVAFAGTTSGSGSLLVSATGTEHPQIASSGVVPPKSVNRYWTITNNGIGGFSSYSPTFTFGAGDLDAGTNTSNFVVKKFNDPTWSSVTTGTRTATTTQATGLTTFSDFAIGEQEDLSIATQPADVTICSAGDASFNSTSTSIPTTTIQWQRKIGVGAFQDITSSGLDAGTTYSGYNTETLSLTGSTASVTGYIYRAVFTNVNGSVTSNEVTLTVQNVLTAGAISYPGGTTHLCQGSDPVAFTNTTAGTGDVLSYKWQSSVSPFSAWNNIAGATASSYDVTSGINQTTQYRRTSVSTVNSVVCESVPTSTIEIIVDQAPTAALAGTDQTDVATCRLVSVTLAANTPTVGTGVWSVVGDPSGSSFSDINSSTSTFSGTVGTPYTLRWTITNSGSVCAPSTDDVNVTLNPSTVASAGIDKTICNTTLTTALTGNAPVLPGESGTWSITSGPDLSTSQFSDVHSASSNFTQTASGNYVLTWTLTNGLCSSSSNTNFLVKPLPSTSVAGTAQAICTSGTALLAANAPVNGTGSWSVFSGPYLSSTQFNNTALPTAVFTPGGGPGVYRLRWAISNSPCTASVSYVNITVGDPNVSSFNVVGATTIIGEPAIITVTSASLAAGSYTITYDMTAGTNNTAVSGTAALYLTAGRGTFTTDALASAGSDNKVTITRIVSATSSCPTILSATSAAFTTQTAGNITAIASTGWNITTTWDCGCIPGSLNDVVIPNGITVTGDIGLVPSNSVHNLTIEFGGGLTDATGVITNILGDLTLNGTLSGSGTLNLNGSNKILDGSGSSTKTSIVAINGNKTIATGANLTLGASVLINGSYTITNLGTFNITGNITGKSLASVWTNEVNSYLKVVGTIFPTANTGTLNTSAVNNTVEFAGLASITLPIPSTQSGYPTFHHLVIAGATGTKTLPATSIAVNGNLTIARSVLSGNATTRILRLRGNWNNAVSTGFTEGLGTVIFDGTSDQTISNTASSIETFTNLKVEKPSGTLNLASNVVVGSSATSTLIMTSGNINTGAFTLTLGYGTGATTASVYAGILNHTSGIVIGKFKRFIFRQTVIGTNILFPIGTSTDFRPALLSLASAPAISGSITAEFKSTDPGSINLPILNDSGVNLNTAFSEGYWSLIPATASFTSNFNLTLTATSFSSQTLDNESRIMVRNSGVAGWTAPIPGTHGVTSGNDISRTGLSLSTALGGREYGLGHASSCPPPIALAITGNSEVCANATGEAYSVVSTPGSTYTWNITGGTQVSGTTTNSITVDWGATGGSVSVTEKNACDVNGTPVTLDVSKTEPVAPTAIVGKLNVPENGPTPVVYYVAKSPGYSYTWDVTGEISFSVLSDSSISVVWGSASTGMVSVRSVNSCGPSTPFNQNINVYVVLVSAANGNWDNTASWSNCTPNPSTLKCDIDETDNVLILNGDEILINVSGARVNNLTIDAGGVLKTGNGIGTFNIYGELTVDGILGEQSSSGVANIHLLRDATNLANPTVDGIGVIANSATLYVDENRDILNTASITKTTGDVQLANGIVLTNNGNVSLGGNLIGANAASTWTNATHSYLTISGALLSTGVLNSSAVGNTVHYNGSSTQNVKRSTSDVYRNIRFSGTGVKSPLADLKIFENWQNDGSGFVAVANKVSFRGTTTITGTTASGFYDVELDGTSLTFPASQVNIAGNLNLITGSFHHGSGTINFNGNSSITYASAPQFNAISVAGTLTSPSDLRVAGNFINNGTFNANGGIVTFNGTSTISGSVSTTFNNVTVAASSTLNAAPMTVSSLSNFGIYNQTGSGTVTVSTLNNKSGATLTFGTGTLSVTGTFTNEGTYTQNQLVGGVLSLSGNLVNSGTLNQTKGSITFAGSTTISGAGTTSFKDVILNGTSLTLPAGTINISGDLTITAGSFNHGNGIINFNGTSSILPIETTSSFYGISIAASSSLTPPTVLKVAGGFMSNGTFNHNNSTVEFNGSLAQNVNGTSPTTFYNVLISNSGGGVTIATSQKIANTLELGSASKIDVGNGLLTLLSTSETQAASVGVIPSNATFNGNLIVQRFMGRINSVNRSIASPVTGAIVSDLADDFSTAYFKSYNETVPGSNTGYYATGAVAPLVSGKGYYGWNAFGTMDVTGPLTLGSSRGDVAIPLTYTPTIPTASSDDGWNFVGNPYPSAINWNATDWSFSADIDPVVYVVDLRANVFRTYNRNTGLGDLPNGNIALGEAFWVRATASNPQLTVKESAKRNTASTYYRKGKVESPTLKISLSNGEAIDNAFLFLAPKTSGLYDAKIDAIKREGELMGISLVSEDSLMLVHYATSQIEDKDIPLNIMASEDGNYSIDFTATGITTGFEGLVLKDVYTHSVHPISSGAYEFTITQNNASKAGRFYLSRNSEMNDNKEVTISFYPNPVSDWTTMEVNAAQDVSVSMFNAAGMEVMSSTIKSQAGIAQGSIDLSGLAPGLYLAKCVVDGRIVVTRLVKK